MYRTSCESILERTYASRDVAKVHYTLVNNTTRYTLFLVINILIDIFFTMTIFFLIVTIFKNLFTIY